MKSKIHIICENIVTLQYLESQQKEYDISLKEIDRYKIQPRCEFYQI